VCLVHVRVDIDFIFVEICISMIQHLSDFMHMRMNVHIHIHTNLRKLTCMYQYPF